ncbi:MAG: Uma2 family endonuclease [Isosphaeraceae bacterium]
MAIVTLDEAVRPRRFTVDEYDRMAEAGILGPDERLELLDGVIYVMSPIGSRHAACVRRLSSLFHQGLAGRVIVSTQNPICLGLDEEPQPDLALLQLRADNYASAHPEASEILLLIEVMETSSPFDRGKKLRSYARAGVIEVWLVDLKRETVEICRQPEGDEYTERRVLSRGQNVACLAFPDLELAVNDILG